MGVRALRQAFTEELLRLARADRRIYALASDSRGSVTLHDFVAALPEQFVECGIAEQNAVGIAAGLARCGLIPFVCGPASFYATRAAEQVKVDVAYSRTNVKIIGVSGGVSYGALGGTHHAVQDIALMRAIPGLQVFLPSDANQMTKLTRALASSGEPAYVRMGRGAVEDIYEEDAPFEIGRANVLRAGDHVTIIACGEMVFPALRAAELLDVAGIHAGVIDMHTLKPLDTDAIARAAQTGPILTVEEHSVHGGLGAAVSEFVCQNRPVKMKILGLPDESLYSGTSRDVFEHYRLTPEGIARAAKELFK
jgi:transketolase